MKRRLLLTLRLLWLTLSLSAASELSSARAQSLVRGPYLQNGSTTAVTVRWRTSSSVSSTVRYGTSASSLTQTVSSGTLKTEHELRLTGLSANTTYYYSVGTSATTLASGSSYFFVTAPSGAKPTRIWVLGDSGTAGANQSAVRDAYYNFTGARHTDLWLMLGDNAYVDGTDAQYQAAVFNVYGAMLRKSVLWATLGNHDGHTASSSSQSGPYYSIFTLPRGGEAGGVASGTEAYHSFDYGNLHFVNLNSYDVDRSTNGAMLTWLRSDLAANSKDWLIAFFHHPPYSKGSHNSDTESQLIDMRRNALPILEAHGVDLVLSGHSHSYERTMFLDGHYGSSSTLNRATMVLDEGSGRADGSGAYVKSAVGTVPNDGAVYVVAGASSKISGGWLNHPAMYISLNVLGSMVLDVDGDRLDAQYLDNRGARRDYFSIVKGSGDAPPTASITNPYSGATFTAPSTVTIAATASDSDGTVSRVDFYAGSTLLGSDRSSPYSFAWSPPVGVHSLVARATDDAGGTGSSAPVSITVTGAGAITSVTFRNGVNGYAGMVDATLSSASGSSNDGSATSLLADGSPDHSAVMKWDLSSIPVGKVVTAVALTFNVVDPSPYGYELYALKRPFSESSTTWQRANSTTLWQVAGANGSNDRETTVLGSVAGSATGSITVNMNGAGRAKVQSWVDAPSSNFGLILLDYAPPDGVDLSSSEAATVSQRPALTVSYQ
jgi:hypothetical protein